jgi:hypothetical protein
MPFMIMSDIYMFGWLIVYCFRSCQNLNLSLIWRYCRWRVAKFRFMLRARQGLWAGRDLYHATPGVIRGLGFSGLTWKTASISRLLRHTRGCGGSILTRIVTGPHSVASYDTQWDAEDLVILFWILTFYTVCVWISDMWSITCDVTS